MFKRKTPRTTKSWVIRQTWIAVSLVVLLVSLASITLLASRGFPFFFYVGLTFIVFASLLTVISIQLNVKEFYEHYVASFTKDKTIGISEKVIRVSFYRNIGIVVGSLLIVLGTVGAFLPPSSFRQQENFNGVYAPPGYTWVVWETDREIPPDRELVLRTDRTAVEFFTSYNYEQGIFGFLVPEEHFNPRRLDVLLFTPHSSQEE